MASASTDLSRAAAARVLGVTVDATQEEVKKAYKAKVMESHPDKGGSHVACQLLNMTRNVMLGGSNHMEDCRQQLFALDVCAACSGVLNNSDLAN